MGRGAAPVVVMASLDRRSADRDGFSKGGASRGRDRVSEDSKRGVEAAHSASKRGKRDKKKDKKDKKKKKKKDKKRKRKREGRSADVDSDVMRLVSTAKRMRRIVADWEPISKKDYFSKSTEFRVWLQGRGKYLDTMSSEESRRRFEKFVSKWNSGSLAEKLYKGINRTEVGASALTKHKWGFAKKLNEQDRFQLARLRDDVDTNNSRNLLGSSEKRSARAGVVSTSKKAESAPPRRESTYEREIRLERERNGRKEMRRKHNLVMEELVPKPTGREAILEKRKQKGAYARAGAAEKEQGVAAVSDSYLMGGSSQSDFAAAVARRDARRARKTSVKSSRLEEARAKERSKMQSMLASIGMEKMYKLQ